MAVNILLFYNKRSKIQQEKSRKSGHKPKYILICLSEEEFGIKRSIKNVRSRTQFSTWCQVSEKYTVSIYRLE